MGVVVFPACPVSAVSPESSAGWPGLCLGGPLGGVLLLGFCNGCEQVDLFGHTLSECRFHLSDSGFHCGNLCDEWLYHRLEHFKRERCSLLDCVA